MIVGLLGLFALCGAAQSQPKGWIIDQERETAPGEYATYKGEKFGWQMWIAENRDGRECKAYKGPDGAELPKPSPVWFTLHDPRVAYISRYGSSFGPGATRVHREFREKGARFFTTLEDPKPRWSDFDGKVLQFRVVGFNHYSRDMHWIDHDFTIDMTGARVVSKWVEECPQ